MISEFLLDIELIKSEGCNLSIEYINDGVRERCSLFLPWCIVQVTTRWNNK